VPTSQVIIHFLWLLYLLILELVIFFIQMYFHQTIQLTVIIIHNVVCRYTDLNLAWSQIRLLGFS